MKKYMEEVVYKETDDKGNVIKEVLGVYRILDPMLLEEIIQYNEDGNYDRVVAAELAVAQAMRMDPIIGRVGGSDDSRIKSMYNRKNKSTLFTEGSKLFIPRRSKLFT